MSSTTSRGNYYKKKTKEYFEKLGYTVQLTEFMCGRIIGPNKIIYTKRDVFGSDGIAMNGYDIIFWNSKHSTVNHKRNINGQVYKARKEFQKYPFPKHIKTWSVVWLPRVKKPLIYE